MTTAWGRWGPDDERGALNLIDAAVVRAAVALVERGEAVPLGRPLGPETPVPPHRARVARFMDRDGGDYAAGARRPGGFQFCEDTLLAPTHAGTHVDALAHVWRDGTLYNGFDQSAVRSTTGATRCGADKLGPVVTRGVLVDLVAGGEHLELGAAVTAEAIRGRLAAASICLRAGDALLIRTGWLDATAADPGHCFAGEPGPDLEAARWLADAGVALVGADNYALEQQPAAEGVFPVHQLLLRDRGIPIVEGLDLRAIADAGAAEFMLVVSPPRLVGASAAPVEPVAIL